VVQPARAAVHLASIALSSARDAASLRRSEASFRSFVENAPAAIFRETRHGRLVTSNPAMVGLLRYRSADALLDAADEGQLYHRPEAREELRRALERSDVVQGMELDWRRADGSLVTVRVSARAYRDDRGELWLWEGYAEDVTLLRAAELALRHNEKLAAVGQLISGVAHELNNPLSSIMHFTEDLLADTRTPEDAEALSVIRDQARRSRSIVRDLLSFVHQRDARAEPILVADVVATTVRVMRPTIELSGARLHVAQAFMDIVVLGDGSGIEQVLTNLLSNAMHAAGHGGDVWLRTDRDRTSCRLIIEDSGAGIPDSIRARIFDPFFTTKPTGEGTGLGLSVTLGIVEQLGGRIEIDSRAPSAQGTRVTVTLPCVNATPRALSGEHPVVTTAHQRRALIIDDEATIRSALRRFFVRRGWDTEEAPDGAAGLELLEDHGSRFDVIISDLRMPGFSGVELHDQLVIAHPALLRRIVFSTGDVASREAAVFVQRTSCHVLQKPFELKTLDDIVARILADTAADTAAERVVT
jgi:PAS domain S-box-containing protein